MLTGYARKQLLSVVGAVALLVVGLFLVVPAPVVVGAGTTFSYTDRFDMAWQALADTYADPSMRGTNWNAVRTELRPQAAKVKDEAAFDSVVKKMLARLHDPNTFYVNPVEVAKAKKENLPQDRIDIVGVGILLGQAPDGNVLAREVLPKGPAARAGIRPGARIAAIDGKPVKGLAISDVAQRIRGKSGTKVVLQVVTPDSAKRDITLTRAAVQFVAQVKSQVLPGNIGYLYIPGGGDGLETKVLAQLRRLYRTNGLIVDLRSGWSDIDLSHMSPMLRIAALFTDQPLGALISRQGPFLLTPELTWKSASEKSWLQSILTPPPTAMDVYKKPLVCIVDNNSTWEMLALGLREIGRAAVVGRTTPVGRGALATGLELADSSWLSVTATYYVSPKGGTLTQGLKPDVNVPLDMAYLASLYKGNDPDIALAKQVVEKTIAQQKAAPQK